MGRVARKEKKQKTKEKRQIHGHAGKALYLEALQLVLRNQILWLVTSKGYLEELETVVRDLWDLRIRGFGSGPSQTEAEDTDTSLEVFSSQTTDGTSGEPILRSKARAKSWDPERGSSWPLPRVIDTVALVYLGCLLLRTPTYIGELQIWANNGHFPYKSAVSLSYHYLRCVCS